MNEMKLHTAADSIPGSVTLLGMEEPSWPLPLGHHYLGACSRASVKCHESITIGSGTINNRLKTAQTLTTTHINQSCSMRFPSQLQSLKPFHHMVRVPCYHCSSSLFGCYAFKAVLCVQQCCSDRTWFHSQTLNQSDWSNGTELVLKEISRLSQVIFITFKVWKITRFRKW